MEERFDERSVVVILGAGASNILGFPLQDEIWDFLRRKCGDHEKGKQDKALIDFIRWNYGDDIEQAFTMLDIAVANRDLNLSDEYVVYYTPKDLKRMIAEAFDSVKLSRRGIKIVKDFIAELQKFDSLAFINLNWDVGLEIILEKMGLGVDYGLRFDWESSAKLTWLDLMIQTQPRNLVKAVEDSKKSEIKSFLVLKPHGSINWNFCPICKKLYCHRYFLPERIAHEKGLMLCDACCGNLRVHLETVLIPPMINKNYVFNYFDSVSRLAHQKIVEADIIIFVGYSFRDTDYDIKYILASALSAKNPYRNSVPKDLHVIVFGDERSRERIENFFVLKIAADLRRIDYARDRIKYAGFLDLEGVKKLPTLLF